MYNAIYSGKGKAIEDDYPTPESLASKAVIWHEGISYEVFDTYDEFLLKLKHNEYKDSAFHEVIFDLPQRLKFDIDAPAEQLDDFTIPPDEYAPQIMFDDLEIVEMCSGIELPAVSRRDKYNAIYNAISDAIDSAFLMTYHKILPPENKVICESHCSEGSKYSNHIIITGFYVESHADAAEFTRRLLGIIPPPYRPFLDAGVNKRVQNFRFPGCHKRGSNRVKQIVSEHTVHDAIIRNVAGCELLPRISVVVQRETVIMEADDVIAVKNLCKADSAFAGYEFVESKGGLFTFAREPGAKLTECDFCREIHHKDIRTLLVSASKINGITTVYRYCRHYTAANGKDGSHVKTVGTIVDPDAPVDESAPAKVSTAAARSLQTAADAPCRSCGTLFERMPFQLRNIYEDCALKPFELVKTLVVKAAMKMGKTKALRQYLQAHFQETPMRKPVIRFLSFRQTFSGNIKEQFPDFTLYSDEKGPLSAPRLIIQVESLHRLDLVPGAEPPDLVILDECESIFEQLNSGLMRGNFNDCFAKFQYLVRYSKHLVCMDANVSDRTYKILEQMRPDFGLRDTSYHCNTHKNGREDVYHCTVDKIRWLSLLYASIEAGDRVAIPITSLTEAKVIAENISRRFPKKALKLYSSETLASEKRAHFANVNAAWVEYDILMYTPTVSAGVSFEAAHYDKVFAYFTDESCGVETCQQMIGRIRDVSSHKYYICMSALGNRGLPTTSVAIKQALLDSRSRLSAEYDRTGLIAEYAKDGSLTYKNDDYMTVWSENVRVRNLSRNFFVKRLVDLFRSVGATVSIVDDAFYESEVGEPAVSGDGLSEALLEIIGEQSSVRAEIRTAECKRIASSEELSGERAEEIRDAMVLQADITPADRAAFDKYRLREFYNFNGEITDKFVNTYNSQRVRRIYKNLTRIAACDTVGSSLEQIKSDELETHKYLMNLGELAQNQDVNRLYVYDQHRYTIGLLKLCGWDDIADEKVIHQAIIVQNLSGNEEILWKTLREACIAFGIKPPLKVFSPDAATLAVKILKTVSKIVNIMYGATITYQADSGMFHINQCKLFANDPIGGETRGVPAIVRPE